MLFTLPATNFFCIDSKYIEDITLHCEISFTHAKNVVCKDRQDDDFIKNLLTELGFKVVKNIPTER